MPRPRRRRVRVLELGLAGVPDPLRLRITKEAAGRLDRALERFEPGGEGQQFFAWDTAKGSIAISLRHVQYASITEMNAAEAERSLDLPDEQDIELRFRGRAPFVTGTDFPMEAYEFMMQLELGGDPFVHFPDLHDKPFWVRIDELVYASLPGWMVKEGVAAFEAARAEENARVEQIEAAEKLIAEVNATARPARSQPPAEGV